MCLERKVNDMSNIDRYLNMTVRDFLILFEPDMRNATDNQRLDELMDLPYEFSCCFSNDDKKHLFCGLGCTHRFTEYVDDVYEIYCEHQKDSALDKNDEYFSNRCAKARLEWLLDK